MKAVALAYARGDGPMPGILMLAHMVDRYGAQAVLHRSYIGAGEAFSMNAAENIVNAYKSRAAAENWATWAEQYPELNRLLISAEMAVNNGDK